ncbi:MAG TPA: T9SS type A sorting domain-containing protein [Candidatus Kapabacteria bacterium]
MYDKYEDAGFKTAMFDDGDNDDVPEPLLVFNKLNGLTAHPTVSSFKTLLKNSVGTEEAMSIEKLYVNMMSDVNTKARPPQIKNLEGSVGQISYHPDVIYTVLLSWDHQVYTVNEYPYWNSDNLPEGIHVYHKDLETEEWELIATLDGDETSYGCIVNSMEYKVSTFNSSGDSYGALTIMPEVLFKKSPIQGNSNDFSSPVISDVSVTPNPFTSSVDLHFELVRGSVLSYELLNILGESVQADNVTYTSTGKKHLPINTSNLPTGTYLLKVLNTDSSGRPTYQTHKISKVQ